MRMDRFFIDSICRCDDVIAHPATEIFANAASFKAISYPGAGHALNYALNASGAYDTILNYLGENGL